MSGEQINRKALTRRDALRGALALAGAVMLPRNALANRETGASSFLSDLGVVSAEMRSVRIRENLAKGPQEIIHRILAENTIKLPPLSELQDSPLNPERLFGYPMLLGSQPDAHDRRRRRLSLIGAGDAGRQVFDLAEAANSRVAHGNVTAIAEQTIITAGHLDSVVERLPEITMLSAAQTDLAVALIEGASFPREQIVNLPEHIHDSEVHGQFVVIPGIDPDATAMYRGMYKVYDGLAFQMTPAMVRALFAVNENDPESVRMWHWAHHSLCVIIPEGEALPHRPREKYPRAAGMSGSPVFMLRNGEYVFVGVFWGVSGFNYDEKSHSLGLFLGPDTIMQLSSMLGTQRRQSQGR